MNKVKILSILIAGAAAAGTPPAFAQDEGARSAGLEQVIVSARRVEENVQDVPLAITALSGDQLEKAGVRTLNDINQAVPSFTMTMATGRSNASIFGIRGQKADDVLMTSDQAVGVYVGGVAQGWPYGIGLAGALDIASFEVAKGPQGTLFGKNTTGGAVIITPNEPSEIFEGKLRAGIGNYNLRELEGMVNTPLTDTLALRVAALGTLRDGTFENLNHKEDFNDRDDWNARVSLKWSPTDSFSSLLVFDQMYSSNHGTAVHARSPRLNDPAAHAGEAGAVALGPRWATALANYANDDFYSAHADADFPNQHQDTRVWGVSDTINYEISDNFAIKNIIAFRQLDLHTQGDLDGVNRFDVPGTNTPFRNRQFTSASQVSEELQLIGSHDVADWIAGVYYARVYGEDGAYSQSFSTVVTQSGPLKGFVNESMALFGQSTFHLTDDLNLTVGLRGTTDNRTAELAAGRWAATSTLANNGPLVACQLLDASRAPLPANNCYSKRSESFHEPTWNLSLDYKLDANQLVYVAHRHGYRSGGIPGRGTDEDTLQPFDQEVVDDFEIGYKLETDVAGMPLRVNTAVFYQDYQDIQRNITLINSTGQLANTIKNAASATIQGGEVEFSFIPFDSLTINGYVAYLDASYEEWTDTINATTTNGGVPAVYVTRDLSSTEFAAQPQWQGNLSVRYQLPLPASIGDVYASVSAYAQSEVELGYENRATDCRGTQQSGYSVYNARIDWENMFGTANWQVSAWGKNLGEKEYYVSALCLYNSTGYTTVYPAEPRTYGVNVTYTFD
jgi:iron complex outermembrane receptor protein